jgi:sugar phosphate isomerase/epimerase
VLLLSTSSLKGYGIHKIFQIAQKSWYAWIDLVLSKEEKDYWDTEYILSLSKECMIPVLSVTAPEKGVNEDMIDTIVLLAQKLGSQVITFSPPHISDKKNSWFRDYLPKIKKETKLSIAIQNVEAKFWLFVIPEYKNATFAQIKNITGDTTLDLSSVNSASGMDIMRAQKALGVSMKNILLSDRSITKTHLLPWGNRDWVLPLESFLMKMNESEYSGFFTLKVSATELGVWDDSQILKHLEDILRKYNTFFPTH